MKKLLIFLANIILLSAILTLSGCASKGPSYVSVLSNDGNVSISVPSGWDTNNTSILPGALIGVSDAANHEYVAVIGEPKSTLGTNTTIATYLAQIKKTSVNVVPDGVWGNPSSITIDGFKGLTARLTGTWVKDKTNTTFFVNVLANNNYYYGIIGCTDTNLVSANEATLQTIINSFHAPTTSVIGSWKPYTFPGSVILFFILLIIGIGLVLLGWQLKNKVKVPHPGKAGKIAIIIVWILLILTFLVVITILTRRTTGDGAGQRGPIFPITLACAVITFIYLAYISRHDGIWAALGNGFIGFAAGPMVFEFPFDMIVIPQVKAPAAFLIAYFGPLDVAVLLTLSLILLSRRVFITRYSMYALGAMFIVWAVWAWFGFSYPSTPISFTLNAISKVLGFISIAALFSTQPKQGTLGKGNKPISGR